MKRFFLCFVVVLCLFSLGCESTDFLKVTSVKTEVEPEPEPEPDLEPEPSIISLVDKTEILEVTGNDNRNDYPLINTIDDNYSSFWTTEILSTNDNVWVLYRFTTRKNIHSIKIYNNYVNKYTLGDCNIYADNDLIQYIDYYNNDFIEGDGVIEIDKTNVLFIELSMTYTGSGAYGRTPSFYISEIDFYEFN